MTDNPSATSATVSETGWLRRVRRLEALASTGLYFSEDDYDRERYQEMLDIAQSMLAEIADLPVSQIVEIFADEPGYRTPKVDVRGAVIAGDRVLLVREKRDGRWTLPGGFADVGYSAAENVVKEISEEANLEVAAHRLYAVRHKTKHRYAPDVRDFYKLFFLCVQTDREQPPHPGLETSGAEFFHRSELPPLSEGRCIAADIEAAFAADANPALATLFD